MSTWNVGNEDLSWTSPGIIDIQETWGPEQRYYSQENLRWTDRKKIFACRGWFVACWPNVVALLCGYLARNKYISRKLHSCDYLYGTGDVSNSSRTLYVGKINRTSLLVNFQTKSIRWWGSSRGNNEYGERIVEMCQGIPLAATVLGGLLRNKKKHEWQAILMGIPLFHLIKMIMEKIALKKSLNSALIIFNLHTWFFFAYFAKFPNELEKDQLI